MILKPKDRELLSLLSANGRASIADLARSLNLSRSTVKDRIARLEREGVITGYTVRFSQAYAESMIDAHVMIESDPKHTASITRKLRKLTAVQSLYAVNGVHDLIAMLRVPSTRELDEVLDLIGSMEGVERTVSSIILSTKFER